MRKSGRQLDAEFFESIADLLQEVDAPPPPRSRGQRGRPKSRSVETCPLVLHLYTRQIAWLDAYADLLASYRPGNKKLKRVEIIRALLLGLAEHICQHRVRLPEPIVIEGENDLRRMLVAALKRQ